jgi:hypothetical protein
MRNHPGVVTISAFAALIAVASCRKESEPAVARAPESAFPAPTATIQPPQSMPDASAAQAPRIPLDVAKEWIETGRVRVLDVRSADDYLNGHIPGALHIPLSRVAGEVSYLPRDKPILTYCT